MAPPSAPRMPFLPLVNTISSDGSGRLRRQPDLIAFKAYWRLSPWQAESLQGRVELLLFPGGYAGLQPVERGRANLCLLIRKSVFARKYGSWESLLGAMQQACPHLGSRLDGAECLSSKPLAVSGLPHGYVAWQSAGLWRLGDQAAVIPSFSGDGMSIALVALTSRPPLSARERTE